MGKEIYYICYPNENLLEAKQLNKEIKALKGETRFIEYGEYDECVNPIKDILKALNESTAVIVIHSDYTNKSMLSQIEITYATNKNLKKYMVQVGKVRFSDSIAWGQEAKKIIKDSNMKFVAKKILDSEGEAN